MRDENGTPTGKNCRLGQTMTNASDFAAQAGIVAAAQERAVPLERLLHQVLWELHKIGAISALSLGMRELGIIVIALVVLSATVPGHSHFVPRPTGPLPAVNVP